MRLAELRERLTDRPAATHNSDDLTMISAALAQRLTRIPPGYTGDLTDCTCGLLLVELPRPITLVRTYTFRLPGTSSTRTIKRPYTTRYAHVARPDGGVACESCHEDPEVCESHTPEASMCDVPDAAPCVKCCDPVKPGHSLCPSCLPAEEEWDSDLYHDRLTTC